ncbi:hypothetical protein ACFV4E_22600 [Streptomyces hygroscopicus]|uniref:hypothetical protein n=1 Tax=Streptomyces hygroscopicus TaxID=1912 RepID=UPI0036BEB9DC
MTTPDFATHPHYSTPCPASTLTAALGKRRAKHAQQQYDQPMTLADLELEKAIDAGTITILDGAWGPKHLPIPLAVDWGLRLTDLVISNGAARGDITEDEARAAYVTIGRPKGSWAHLCDAAMLRDQHQRRVFVLSERPELFGLTTLWEVGYSLGDLSLGTGPEAFDVRTTAETAAEQTTAPFTPQQVEALEQYQATGDMPLRCGRAECAAAGNPPVLIPGAAALTCPVCGWTRSWVWKALVESEGSAL